MIAALGLMLAATAATPAPAGDWRLVWSDEFDGPAIDRAKWDFDVDCWGGGNNERQCYTDDPRNAAVEDGRLVITARKERATGPAWPVAQRSDPEKAKATATKDFTSARLVTRGKAAWTYGKVEVRAKLPQGQGTWPAIWMLPDDARYGAWAASGEIDILEAVNLGVACNDCTGGIENRILGTLHFGGTAPDNVHKGAETVLPAPLDGWHVFGIVWRKGRFDWTIDGRVYATQVAGDWNTAATDDPAAPFDRPFHLILNLAIGGGLPESRTAGGVDESGYPKRMEIDWVRVWQSDAKDASSEREAGGEKD
ncbi:glycoside hydrolase family 16 protein [Sphingopyxis indica]|uniref:Beta-glucanase, GH16 family n=1 Tax=Sphingopyxis indica TaxID=436663 RepID=A0A239DCG9_9SPHN|nr:glycoside hydrolase family 16 protein [Sphingopyxis indica]SNS30085.1 Beta-glucanase, GH16 family [Sphingopyxis indica]